jgi:hypothetical protein
MPSPFPGMNPYLEHRFIWPDFHERMIVRIADALTPQVVPRYYVGSQHHIFLTDGGEPDEWGEPTDWSGRSDVSVLGVFAGGGAAVGTVTAVAPAAVSVPTTDEPVRAAWLEIRSAADDEVVTVIELLSPSNKYAGPDRDRYVFKRSRLLVSRANLVEIDLLRGGPPMDWHRRPPCDYSVAVSRVAHRPTVDFWPLRLRDRLPVIPVPLRPGETEPLIDLQTLLHQVYDAAAYHLHVYRHPLTPALSAADAEWATAVRNPQPPGGTA